MILSALIVILADITHLGKYGFVNTASLIHQSVISWSNVGHTYSFMGIAYYAFENNIQLVRKTEATFWVCWALVFVRARNSFSNAHDKWNCCWWPRWLWRCLKELFLFKKKCFVKWKGFEEDIMYKNSSPEARVRNFFFPFLIMVSSWVVKIVINLHPAGL